MICFMAPKTYSDEFRRQAVDLYQSTPGATLKAIAADLGISRCTLQRWVRELGSATPPTARPRPPAGSRSTGAVTAVAATTGHDQSQAARIAELEARVAELETEQTKLATERDILRQAAKYFAGETNW